MQSRGETQDERSLGLAEQSIAPLLIALDCKARKK